MKQLSNKILVVIIFLLFGVLLGLNIQSFYPNTIDYFAITFPDLLNFFTTLVMGIFVAIYIGKKISDTSKVKEIRLEALNKFENQYDKLFEYFYIRLSGFDSTKSEKITNLFNNIIGMLEILKEESDKSIVNKRYKRSISEIYSEIIELWELMTSDPLNDLTKHYDESDLQKIHSLKHSIATNIHVSKVAIFS